MPVMVGLPPAVALPVGRPSLLALEMLDEHGFFEDLMAELRTADEVVATTFMYDDPRLHGVFLSRLGNPRRPFKLELMVDRQAAAGEGGRKYMRPRLRELKTAGAQVWLCDGHNHTEILGTGAGNLHGHVHVKGVVVDRRVAYTGSMNLTRAARTNREIMFKIRGAPVVQFLEHMLGFRDHGASL